MSDKLSKDELLGVIKDCFEAKELDLQSLFYDIPTKEFNERKKKLRTAKKQILARLKPQMTDADIYRWALKIQRLSVEDATNNLIHWLEVRGIPIEKGGGG